MKTNEENEEFAKWAGTPINEEDSVSDELGRMKPLASAQVAFNYAYQTRQPEIDALKAKVAALTLAPEDDYVGMLEETNASLKAEVRQLRDGIQTMGDALADGVWAHLISSDDDLNALDAGISSVVGKISTLRTEVERLKEALRPFAAYADHYPTDKKYGNRPATGEWHSVASREIGMVHIDVEDFHRAKAAIKGEEK